ncbi:hypothetical protein H0H92_002723 [Tricholoma furcatifolium]|nr:hypothetical protein H0H92_002723 [Tricholoma furcatifolium]
MTETSIELKEHRETSRKQVAEECGLPTVGTLVSDSSGDASTSIQHPAKTKKQIAAARIQFLACCVPLFLAGWNDGTQGPLLPRIQTVYNVAPTPGSKGFFTGALANVPLSDKLGFGKVTSLEPILIPKLGSTLQAIGYTLMAPALPFPVLLIAYMINGFGLALQDAQANGYVASLDSNAETKMGILHAVYGAGALCSPLVATQFAQYKHWSFHYLASLGISIFSIIVLVAVFRFRTQDECLTAIGQVIQEHREETGEQSSTEKGKFGQIMKHKTVQLLAFYILVYVGVEVTMGGWIVTYIIEERHGGPSSGYISSGFFGGLMTGRVVLLWVNEKIGERRVVFLYALLVLGLEIVIWLVPSLIGNAVAVSIVGLLLGPMYPIAMNHAARVLPRWILTGSIGWIAGFGQTGSAILPFITGAISTKYGIKTMQPFLVAMVGLMTALWAIVPGYRRPD